jgi:hypothetical protein
VDAVGELAKLAERDLGIAGGLREERSSLEVALGLCACAREAEVV